MPSVLCLKINNQSFLNLVLEKGDSPIIKGDGSNILNEYTIEGSKESLRLMQFQLAFSSHKQFLDSLQLVFESSNNDPSLAIQLQKYSAESITRRNDKFLKIINQKPGSLVSLAAVQQLNREKYKEILIHANKSACVYIKKKIYIYKKKQKHIYIYI